MTENPIVRMFRQMIAQAEDNIASINKQLADDPPATVLQLHALRSLQNMWRDNIDRLRAAKQQFR